MTIMEWEQKTNKRETNICKKGTMGLSKDEVTHSQIRGHNKGEKTGVEMRRLL